MRSTRRSTPGRALALAFAALALVATTDVAGAGPVAGPEAGPEAAPVVARPGAYVRTRNAIGRGLARVPGQAANLVGGAADRASRALVTRGERLSAEGGAKARLGRALARTGRGVDLFLGTETLRSISFQAGGYLVLGVPGHKWFGNVAVGGRVWSGSVDYWEDHTRGPNTEKHLTGGAVLNTPVFSYGHDSLWGKPYSLVSTPFVALLKGDRAHALQVGLPFVASVSVGDVQAVKPGQYDRGPFVSATAGTPLSLGILKVGVSATVYYRPLGLLSSKLERPARWYGERFDRARLAARHGTDAIRRRLGFGPRAAKPVRDRATVLAP